MFVILLIIIIIHTPQQWIPDGDKKMMVLTLYKTDKMKVLIQFIAIAVCVIDDYT